MMLDTEQKAALVRKLSDGFEKLGIALIAVGIYGDNRINIVFGLINFGISLILAAWRKKT
jgi:hypothetical protein